MRRLILAACFVLVAGSATAQPSEVGGGSQRKDCSTGGSRSATLACAFTSNVTSGNLLILAGGTVGGTTPFASSSVTGSGSGCSGTTFTSVQGPFKTTGTGNDLTSFVAYGIAGASGACTVTFDPDGAGTYWMSYAINEWSGSAGVNVAGTGDSADSLAPSTDVTTTAINTLIVGAMTWAQSNTAAVAGGLTEFGEDENWAVCCNHSAGFKTAAGTGSQTADWTLSGVEMRPWTAVAVSFCPATCEGGGGVNSPPAIGPFIGGVFAARSSPTESGGSRSSLDQSTTSRPKRRRSRARSRARRVDDLRASSSVQPSATIVRR